MKAMEPFADKIKLNIFVQF